MEILGARRGAREDVGYACWKLKCRTLQGADQHTLELHLKVFYDSGIDLILGVSLGLKVVIT